MKEFDKDNKWCHIKSSMDPLVNRIGRLFGGVGFICDKDQFAYRILGCDSDRVCCITGAPKLINSDLFLEKRATVPIKTQGVQRSSSGKMSTF